MFTGLIFCHSTFAYYVQVFVLGNKISLYCQCVGKTSFHVATPLFQYQTAFSLFRACFILNQCLLVWLPPIHSCCALCTFWHVKIKLFGSVKLKRKRVLLGTLFLCSQHYTGSNKIKTMMQSHVQERDCCSKKVVVGWILVTGDNLCEMTGVGWISCARQWCSLYGWRTANPR